MAESDAKGRQGGQHKPDEEKPEEVPYFVVHLHPILKAAGFEPRYLAGGHLTYDSPDGEYSVMVSPGGFCVSRSRVVGNYLEGPNDPQALKQAMDQIRRRE